MLREPLVSGAAGSINSGGAVSTVARPPQPPPAARGAQPQPRPQSLLSSAATAIPGDDGDMPEADRDGDVHGKAEKTGAGGFPAMMVQNKNGLGTVQGVFVPCMLSIVGLVLFMRLGWAIGEAGVLGVLSMIAFGCFLILLTVLSLCALATNGKIRGGGAYYLISRSLGPEFGGAIGVIFFAANAVGIAFYMQGFSDTLASPQVLGLDPKDEWTRWIKLGMACGCLAVETVIAIVGSSAYAKTAFLIFLLQTLSVGCGAISIFTNEKLVDHGDWKAVNMSSPPSDDTLYNFSFAGPNWDTLHSNLGSDYSNKCSGSDHPCDYATVFKTIFPALTGIMAGANMSGVLKRPEISIPWGELAAVGCSTVTYIVITLALGASVPRATLKGQYLILSQVTWFPIIDQVPWFASARLRNFSRRS